MPIPGFTIEGVLPPFVGANGPGGAASDMTPYKATLLEVIERFADTDIRRAILRDWLTHRAEMRALGVIQGFQWLDGSFVEDKAPRDLDIVTFFRRPAAASSSIGIQALFIGHPEIFRKAAVKQRLKIDAMFVDLDATPEAIVEGTRYYGGLFSHRREDGIWKGMVAVPLEDAQDADAGALLDGMDALDLIGEGHEEDVIQVEDRYQ